MKKIILVILIIVVIIVVLAVIYLWPNLLPKEEKGGVKLPQVEVGKAVENPLEGMPSANPYEEVVNPFKEAYKNPFK